jgi:hypothetical protein
LYRGCRFIGDTPKEIKYKFEIVLKWLHDNDDDDQDFFSGDTTIKTDTGRHPYN